MGRTLPDGLNQCVANALGVEFKPYHIASDFLAAVAPKEWDFTGNLLGDKSVTVVFDCTKLKRAVPGFQCTTRFDEGVRRCVAYILAHPELQVDTTCGYSTAALAKTRCLQV